MRPGHLVFVIGSVFPFAAGTIPAIVHDRPRVPVSQPELVAGTVVKLKHWIRFLLHRDSTWHGQFAVLGPLLLEREGVEPVVVDVGANDGFYSSNSYPFIARRWQALLIEPHPTAFRKAQRLHKRRQQVTVVNAACSDRDGTLELQTFVGDEGGSHSVLHLDARAPGLEAYLPGERLQVEAHRLETLMKKFNVPQGFGLLSIDTEGHDLQVLRGANLPYFRPQVIITEINSDDEEKFAFLRENGYRLRATLSYDTVWTRV